MAANNFDACLAFVLKYEGGYVNHPRDPGGPTNLGVTQGVLTSWLQRPASISDVKGLTVAAVTPIYKARYWLPIFGDDMPAGVDLALFDWGVNSGPSHAARDLQAALGVTVDGAIGGETLDAVGKQNPAFIIRAVCDRRMAYYKSLGTWDVFGRGWTARADAVLATALQMATTVPHASGPVA